MDWSQVVYYDESSPTFLRWKINGGRGGSKRSSGDVAGSIKSTRYGSVFFNGKKELIHRVVLKLHNKTLDGCVVDHIDGDSFNNNIKNLRVTTLTINNRNRSLNRNNTSGKTGVVKTVNSSGCLYWIAQWIDNKGNNCRKFFRDDRFENAYEEACKYRDKMIKSIGDYTERNKQQ